jgi:hypothetical protein
MLPQPKTMGSLALATGDRRGNGPEGLAFLGDVATPANGARLLAHALGGDVDVADMEAVLRPIREAAGPYAAMPGAPRDLAWEKGQYALAVEAETRRGRTEAEAVQAVNLLGCDRWPHLPAAGKDGGDQRCLPNYRRWKRAMGTDARGMIRRDNWDALAKRRGGGQVNRLDAQFMETFFSLYLHPNAPGIEPTRRKVEAIWRLRGWEESVPTAEQVRLAVKKCVKRTLELKYRDQRNRFANLVKGWIRRDVNAEAGEIFFMDHRICDFWARTEDAEGNPVAVRPYITAVFDARSFVCVKAIVYADSNPNHERILECFQEAVRRAGNAAPRVLYIDNGKDFLKIGMGTPATLSEKGNAGTVLCRRDGSPYAYSVMGALGVEVRTARGYNGKEKPIERWFRDMATDWERTRVGYCGNSPATRPDYGDTWQGDVMRLETVGQALASLDRWIETEANRQPREDGRTRGEMWEGRRRDARPRFEDLDLFVRLLLPQRTAPIVRRSSMGGGVAFAGWQYSHADLHEFFGQPVMVKTCWHAPRVEVPVQTRGRGKVRRQVPACVFVFTLDDRLICGAVADPLFDMFGETDEHRARLGAAQHLINAVVAQDSERFRELTGRSRIADPSRVLAELEAAAAPTATVALTGDPTEATRRKVRRVEGTLAVTAGPGQKVSREDVADVHEAIVAAAREFSRPTDVGAETAMWTPFDADEDGDEEDAGFAGVIMAAGKG